jgi:hypothetical protein
MAGIDKGADIVHLAAPAARKVHKGAVSSHAATAVVSVGKEMLPSLQMVAACWVALWQVAWFAQEVLRAVASVKTLETGLAGDASVRSAQWVARLGQISYPDDLDCK